MSALVYLDKAGILHAVSHSEKEAAERDASSEVITADISHKGGFPEIEITGQPKQYIYYSKEGKGYVDGNVKDGKEYPIPENLDRIVDRLK